MIDTFPIKDSKEIILAYAKDCNVWEATLLKILPLLNKDEAVEMVLAARYMPFSVMCALLKVITVEELTDVIIKLKSGSAVIDDANLVESLAIFDKDDQRKILQACIKSAGGLDDDAIIKLFDHYPKDEVEGYLRLCIENNNFMGDELLQKIIEVYSGDVAASLLESHFFCDSGRDTYTKEEQEYYLSLIS